MTTITHTVRLESTRVGEREIYAAAEAARLAGATHFAIEAISPLGGYYRAKVGRVAEPIRTVNSSQGESGGNPIDDARGEWMGR